MRPFPGASELVAAIRARGLTIVAASSAKRDELRALLDIAGVSALLDGATSNDDAEESKPDPEIVQAALNKAGAPPREAVMIGATPYAGRKVGVINSSVHHAGWWV